MNRIIGIDGILFFIFDRLALVAFFLILGTVPGGLVPKLAKLGLLLVGIKFAEEFLGIIDHMDFQVGSRA